MTDENQPDLEARFHMDQEDAAAEAQTQADYAWSAHVRHTDATHDAAEAVGKRIRAQASALEALALLAWLLVLPGLAAALLAVIWIARWAV